MEESNRIQQETNDELKDTKIDVKKLIKINTNISSKLEESHEMLDDNMKEIMRISNKLKITSEHAVVNVDDEQKHEYLVIMKSSNIESEYTYYCIRGQLKTINRKKIELSNDYIEIKTIKCCPNARMLWNLIKEKLSNDYVYFYGSNFNLLNIDENDFILKIQDIYDTRKSITYKNK